MNICFVQLARAGDLINILPICRQRHLAGDRVTVMVQRQFAGVMDAVGYARAEVWDGAIEDVPGAIKAAEQLGFDRVIPTQIQGNPVPLQRPATNFAMESWARAWCEEDFHSLPLVLDRRDCDGEAKAVSQLIPPGDLPVLVHALEGHSSPFANRGEFSKWLIDALGDQYRIVDLCAQRLPRLDHLLGPMSVASVGIYSDSAPLHLSYAIGKPAIALHADKSTWFHAEPRAHWIANMTYSHALSPAGKAELLGLLRRPKPTIPPLDPKARITHVVDWWEPPDKAHRNRLRNARDSWRLAAVADGQWDTIHPTTNRSSLSIGDTRRLPFIKDLLDAAVDKPGNGIVAISNSDSILTMDAGEVLRRKLDSAQCCYSHRVDVDGEAFTKSSELAGRSAYAGIDLFAFRADWWRKHRDEYPDLLYGVEAWDGVLRFIFLRHNPNALIDPPVVYHQKHEAFWSRSENVMDNPGQRWNRAVATVWALEHGMLDKLGTGHILFK